MPEKTLEARVKELEAKVAELFTRVGGPKVPSVKGGKK